MEQEQRITSDTIRKGFINNQFFVVFQPIIYRDGSVSFELLMRFNNNGQHISPSEFIPVAEESGLSSMIFDYGISGALEFYRSASRANKIKSISVNIAPIDMVQDGFLRKIYGVKKFIEQKMPDSSDALPISFELTEGMLASDIYRLADVVAEIRDLGFLVAVDDFGTGHSSLSRVTSIPVDIIKLDKSFIRNGLSTDSLSKLVAFCHSLGAQVIIEGVETLDAMAVSLDAGCDAFQGFLISRPMLASAATHWRPGSRQQDANVDQAKTFLRVA